PITHHQLGKVISIQSDLSDPHQDGKSVIALAFESGLKVVYKPKGLGVELAYTQFLEWCNQQGVPLPFKILKICDRQTHGWVEYAEHLPCADEAAAGRFYQRAGMLLCLLYALRVVDCHRENLVACGEHFVLVDMETLMQPEAKPLAEFQDATAVDEAIEQHFWDSVLRTGLLPRWDFRKNDRIAYDISALGYFSLEPPRKSQARSAPLPSGIPNNVPILKRQNLEKSPP
ncbi:MAG TPA: type 2 lantipeptide synthetase LanM, partial [Cyanobacteria bacterium UBA8803]|nr:type 2 lantipeptide synthetase LanM [Cyanobacteria bacterium UBA8803]